MTERWTKLGGADFLTGAHHPHCGRHNNHLIWLGGRPLCLGCCSVAVGFPLGLLTTWQLGTTDTSWTWFLIHFCLIAPTAAQPWLQFKRYKIISRMLAGGFFGSMLVFCLFNVLEVPSDWWAVLLTTVTCATLFRTLLALREKKTPSPCDSCPLGRYPTCEWNMPRLLESADATLQEALRVGDIEVR